VAFLESILENIELDFQGYSFTAALECLESKRFIEIQSDKKTFIFLHDRIQQAAYNLLIEQYDVQLLSFRIGRLILEEEDCTQDCKSNFKFLMAVNQVNRGRALLDSTECRVELVNHNFQAAKEVIRLSAFNLARNFEISLEILGENCWENHYSLTLTINSLLASVLSASGLMNESLHLIANISENCKRVEDRYDTQILRLEILACINDLDECFAVSKVLLSDLRIPSVSLNPSTTSIFAAIFKLKRSFSALSHEDVLALPRCEDKRIQHAMKICR
jgi:predicted ATPase